MAWNSAGKRKLQKEFLQPGFILAYVGIDLAVGALEVSVSHDGRAAVAGAGDVDHVEVVFHDDPVQMHVNEVLPGGRAPMSQQHVLHIRERQRSLQQWIVVEINLPDCEVVRGTPIGVNLVEQFWCECVCIHGLKNHSLTFRSRRALLMTETELRLIAAPAMIGLSSQPKNGYSTPAATGIPSAL